MRKYTKHAFIFLIVTSCLLALVFFVYPSKKRIEGNSYIWNGELTLKELTHFDEAVKTGDKISTIEFVNSRGAGASGGVIVDKIEKIINEHSLDTSARGQCASACAYAFLFGNVRTLLPSDSSRRTYLLLHAARDGKSGEVNYGASEEMNKRVAAKSGGKFPLTLLNRIFDDKIGNGDGEIYVFREPVETKNGLHHVFVCDGQKRPVLAECEVIEGVTPRDLGIKVGD